MNKIVYQISMPRSGSTALMRSFEARGDFKIMHEPTVMPFDIIHYTGESNSWFKPDHPMKTHAQVKEHILRFAENSNVYIKDMIFSSHEWLVEETEFSANPRVHFVLMVRNPYDNMVSLYKKVGVFALDQTMIYRKMYNFYTAISRINPNKVIIINADKFFGDPRTHLRHLSQELGISYSDDYLQWSPKEPGFDGSEWLESKTLEHFQHWHGDAITSTGFSPLPTYTPDFSQIKPVDFKYLKSLYQPNFEYHNKLTNIINMRPKLLWCIDYYDGPLTGVAEWDNKKVYFDTKKDGGWTTRETDSPGVDDAEYESVDGKRYRVNCEDRVYNLYELPAEIFAVLKKAHQEFIEVVTDPEATDITFREFYEKCGEANRVTTSGLTFIGEFTQF